MFGKFRNKVKAFKLSLRSKMVISLSLIAAVLFISSAISILEYRKMSNYVSQLIGDNIRSINLTQELSTAVDSYNLGILKAIGYNSISGIPDFDQNKFVADCDSLKNAIAARSTILPLADSVLCSYNNYMQTSMELEEVIQSDFINSREWYFDRLQPVFGELRGDIDMLSAEIFSDLQANSAAFDEGFGRSVIPGAVAIAMGIILVLLLMFFISVYYVSPIYKMLDELENYIDFARKYDYTFDGDDELSQLNAGITEITEENRLLRLRLKKLKENKAEDES